MKRSVVFAVTTFLGCFTVASSLGTLPKRALGSVATSVVQADGGCSLSSLSGPYAVARQGTLVTSVPALGLVAPAPWAESALAVFDGSGTFSGKATVNIGGAVVNPTFTGTYTVNRDCTGELTVNSNVGVSLHEAFIVIGGGQRFITTETDSLAVVQSNAQRLGD